MSCFSGLNRKNTNQASQFTSLQDYADFEITMRPQSLMRTNPVGIFWKSAFRARP